MLRRHALICVVFALPLAAQTATYAVFTPLTASPAPTPRERALMVHDETRGRTLLAGGSIGGSVQAQTWEFDGSAWTQVSPPNQLNFNRPVRLVYSPLHGKVLAVTGDDTYGGPAMVVRAWTGTNWTVLSSNGPPSRAYDYELAWDASRGVLVMFGGGYIGVETWEWDGAVWSQRGTGGPVARTGHRMVYDEARQVVVLQGGEGLQPLSQLTDTWEWNGIYWLERFGIPSPQSFARSVMVYDRARQRVVLHGGYYNGGTSGGVFELDTNGWVQVPTVAGPSGMINAAAAYVPSTDEVVLFGGAVGGTLVGGRTMRLVTGTLAGSFPHHVGCAGPAGVPTVAAVGASRPVLGSPFQLAFGSLPNTPLSLVFAAFGTSDQTWNGIPLPLDLTPLGFTSCSLFVEPSIVEPLANVGGAANWTLSLPSSPSLDGVEFFVQGLVLTQGFNPAGAVMSSSLRGVVGVL